MTSEYKLINTTSTPIEVPKELVVELAVAPEDLVTEEIVEPVVEAPKPLIDKKEVKRRSRAAERIEQLLENQRNLEQRLRDKDASEADLRKQVAAKEKMSKEELNKSLNISYTALAKQLSAAIREADGEAAVAIQDKMMDIKTKQAELGRELTEEYIEVKPDSRQEQPIRQQPKVPEAALDWIADHPLFKTDELFHGASMTVNNQLLREGFDPESQDFYEELSDRLIKRFPEAFNTQEESSVQLSQRTPSGTDVQTETPDVNTNRTSRTATPRTTEQVVSGSTRPSASQVQQAKVDKITLSHEQMLAAEQSGISYETMAKRIKHIADNKRLDGYTPILMKK